MLRREEGRAGLMRSVRRTVAAVTLPLALSGCAFGVLHGKHGSVVGGFISPTAPIFTSGNPSKPTLVPAPYNPYVYNPYPYGGYNGPVIIWHRQW